MKLSGEIWILPLCICMLLSCQQEQGNWTAVNQEDLYLYGVWKAPTRKRAKQAIADIFASIQIHIKSQPTIEMAQEQSVQTPSDVTPNDSTPRTNIKPEEDYKRLTYLSTDVPEDLLPRDGETEDWVRSRKVSTYNPNTLYIDRAVDNEVFLNYGFQMQAEVEYQSPKFGSVPYILLEIFDMGTPENAFGIFSVNSYSHPKYEWVGCKAIISGKYLRFWKGKYFIQIEGYAIATGIREGMVALATVVAKRIQDPTQKIPYLNILPVQQIRGSEKLFYTNSTLREVYKSAPNILPQFTEKTIGVLAHYSTYSKKPDNPSILFVVRFPSAAKAKSAYTEYQNTLRGENVLFDIDSHSGAILVDEFSSKP